MLFQTLEMKNGKKHCLKIKKKIKKKLTLRKDQFEGIVKSVKTFMHAN